MINPHFIVDAGRRCMCGNYDGESITCANILADLQSVPNLPVSRIKKTLLALLEECKDPLVIEGVAQENES